MTSDPADPVPSADVRSAITPARVALAAGAVVLLVITALVILVDDPESDPPRLRERIVLADGVSSELTGATVSITGNPMMLEVAVGGEILCSFEVRRPKNHLASRAGDTWLVIVRRVDVELRTVDVRVDRIPGSGDPDGCLTEEPGRG